MPKKAGADKAPSKVMETLSNAVNMFQVPNLNMLATDTGLPFENNLAFSKSKNGKSSDKRGRAPVSTIMCPW
ncbi:MAG TPA: hypothetical protein VHZ74_12240 [Bryobacteraceae bacterium]|jgi:hypothetical protein|nr:hypothetical protein [Bryobacteraceae bacterium]